MAIRERVKQYESAYNSGDGDAVAAIYAVNGTHTYALGFTHRGRLEIGKGLKEQFAGPMRSGTSPVSGSTGNGRVALDIMCHHLGGSKYD